MMTKKKKIWIGVGAVVALTAIIYFSIKATSKEEVLVQTSKASRRDVLKAKVSASGEIRAKEFIDLQTEIAGVVTEVPVREGDSVKKGDILLKIDPIQTEAETASIRAQFDAANSDARAQEFQIMNAEANLLRDEASLRSARAELEQAESNNGRSQNTFKRKQQLHEDGLVSREEYEAAMADAKVAKAQLDMARARVSQGETQVKIARNNIEQMQTAHMASSSRAKSSGANLTRANDQLKKTTLYSPLTGVITQLLVEKGERAVPGIMSNPQATLMTIADLSVIQAELKVDETDVINLQIGNPATVKVDAMPDMTFDGEVTEIGNSPIKSTTGATTQEAKDFKVIVTVKNPSIKLRPGMSCTGDIITATKSNVLVVPIQALTIREVEVDKDGKYKQPDLKQKKAAGVAQADTNTDKTRKKELEGLFVVNSEKVARFRPVKTGITGESEIEVIENLKDGEEVVSGSFQTLRTIKDGAAVKVEAPAKGGAEKKS
jgi:HlyD family secretion protein